MALTMNRIAPSLFVVALLAIASLTRPGTRRPQADPIPTFGMNDLQQRVSRATVLLEAVNRRDSIIRSLPESINAEAPLLAMDERLPSAHRSMAGDGAASATCSSELGR